MKNNMVFHFFKKLSKTIGYFCLFLVAFIGIYLLLAFGLSKITVFEEVADKPEIPVYILTNGVHTDIVMPVKTDLIDWSERMPYANTVSKDSEMNFLAIGWGDKGFYLKRRSGLI